MERVGSVNETSVRGMEKSSGLRGLSFVFDCKFYRGV